MMKTVVLKAGFFCLLQQTFISANTETVEDISCSKDSTDCIIDCQDCFEKIIECPTTSSCNSCVINCSGINGCEFTEIKSHSCKDVTVNCENSYAAQSSIIHAPTALGDLTLNAKQGENCFNNAYVISTNHASNNQTNHTGKITINCDETTDGGECENINVNALYATSLEFECRNEANCNNANITCPSQDYGISESLDTPCVINCDDEADCSDMSVYTTIGLDDDVTWICDGDNEESCQHSLLFCSENSRNSGEGDLNNQYEQCEWRWENSDWLCGGSCGGKNINDDSDNSIKPNDTKLLLILICILILLLIGLCGGFIAYICYQSRKSQEERNTMKKEITELRKMANQISKAGGPNIVIPVIPGVNDISGNGGKSLSGVSHESNDTNESHESRDSKGQRLIANYRGSLVSNQSVNSVNSVNSGESIDNTENTENSAYTYSGHSANSGHSGNSGHLNGGQNGGINIVNGNIPSRARLSSVSNDVSPQPTPEAGTAREAQLPIEGTDSDGYENENENDGEMNRRSSEGETGPETMNDEDKQEAKENEENKKIKPNDNDIDVKSGKKEKEKEDDLSPRSKDLVNNLNGLSLMVDDQNVVNDRVEVPVSLEAFGVIGMSGMSGIVGSRKNKKSKSKKKRKKLIHTGSFDAHRFSVDKSNIRNTNKRNDNKQHRPNKNNRNNDKQRRESMDDRDSL